MKEASHKLGLGTGNLPRSLLPRKHESLADYDLGLAGLRSCGRDPTV